MATPTEEYITLVLGHGRNYSKDYIHCSPLPVDQWFHDKYICVDFDGKNNPDILYDLRRPWKKCNNKFDRIIDTTGLGLHSKGYKMFDMKEKILHSLKENGVFYGYGDVYGCPICWKKQGGVLVDITPENNM